MKQLETLLIIGFVLLTSSFSTALSAKPVAVFNAVASGLSVQVTANDSPGNGVVYSWEAVHKYDSGNRRTASGQSATFNFSVAGEYKITLTVRDDRGESASLTQTVTVEPKPPQARFTLNPATGQAPLTVNVNGSGSSDADGSIVSYRWQADGQSKTGQTAQLTFPAAGTYTVTLTVTDDDGLTGSASEIVQVSAPPKQAPVAVINSVSPVSGTAPLTVSVDGSGSSDADGNIVSYRWQAGGQSKTGANAQLTFDSPGTYTVTLTVTDNDGLTDSTSDTVQVSAPPKQAPVAVISSVSPVSGTAPLSVRVDGSGSSDADGSIVRYQWQAGGQSKTGSSAQLTFDAPGSYTVALTVTDNDGLTDSTVSQSIQVSAPQPDPPEPSPQSPRAAFSATPSTGEIPLTVKVDAGASSDADGTIRSYRWQTTAGHSATGRTAQFDFSDPGDYQITLTVTDNSGLTATARHSVEAQPLPPVAAFTVTVVPESQQVPATVTADAAASADADGTITAYRWAVSDGQSASGAAAEFAFEHAGTYILTLTVEDNHGASAQTTRTLTIQPPPDNRPGVAIIIAGGGAEKSNTLFDYTHDFTERMYRLLRWRGFADEDIFYLSPRAPDVVPAEHLDGDLDSEYRDFDLLDSDSDLPAAFAQAALRLASAQQFVLYLHGHARPGYLDIRPPNPELSAARLSALLDTLPADKAQIIILDTCFSGSFVEALSATGRTVITSADDRSAAYHTEYLSFSDSFIRALRRGYTVGDAFDEATRQFSGHFGGQTPWLDDDGDGIANTSRDGAVADGLLIGNNITGANPPVITPHGVLTLDGTTAAATLWVTTGTDSSQVRQVRAVVRGPDSVTTEYQGQSTQFGQLELELLYNANKQRYEVDFERFCTPGTWEMYYQLEDTLGVLSDRVKGQLVQADPVAAPICGDDDVVSVKIQLNALRYSGGESFRLGMTVDGAREVTPYVAILFPAGGGFVTYSYSLGFSFPNALYPYRDTLIVAGARTYPVLEFPLPATLPAGTYQACGVLTAAGETDVLNAARWLDSDCQAFEFE